MRKLLPLLCLLAAPALALATNDSKGRLLTHPTNEPGDTLGVTPPPGMPFSRTNQGVSVLNPGTLNFSKTNQGASVLNPGALDFSKTNQGASILNPLALDFLRAALDLLGVSRTQTGMSNAAGDFVAAHVLPIGVLDSVSCYTVALAVTPTDLVPAALVGASHIAITNLGNQSFYIGGTDVSTTNGVVLAQNATYTMDGVNRRTKVYAVKTGVPTQTVAVMRW